ncbi:MAG: iron(III) ABC transporter [SAR86 cluster bacterium]|uniref:Iron(III) ABC transporter n=1 Tax=SAR86 cluster bacterium TaxID=2030880 RepID=A0A2A4WY49_9GAMM|nr:MAG: iron(III) ABC transporter [SAR86 cluster bacterium]
MRSWRQWPISRVSGPMRYISNGCKWVERIKSTFSLTLLLLAGCTSTQLDQAEQWQSQLYTEHALVGMIWDSQHAQFIAPDELLARIEGVSYLLLGEKHDNPDHHALQLRALDHVLQTGNVSTVSFEMMSSEQQPLLQELSSHRQSSLEQINEYLQWDNEGWDWDYYGPLLKSAMQADVKINAANISNEEMMQVYSAPTEAKIAAVLDKQTMAALEKDIDESHCGMLPESQFPAMVRVQQARDFAMARSLSTSSPQQVQVLIAGNYHIRRDLGVPNYLLNRQSNLEESQIISLAFMEVDEGSNDPDDYLQQFGSVKAHDYIWFTPAVSNEDYCASLRQQ